MPSQNGWVLGQSPPGEVDLLGWWLPQFLTRGASCHLSPPLVLAVRILAHTIVIFVFGLAAPSVDLFLVFEVGGDGLFSGGVIHGDIEEFPRGAEHLPSKGVDEPLAGGGIDEGMDGVGIGDVGEFILLPREMKNIFARHLSTLLLAVAQIH